MTYKMLITNETNYKVYRTEADAIAAAAILQADDEDGWTYEVRVDPKGTGKALIAILDEDGHFISNMI